MLDILLYRVQRLGRAGGLGAALIAAALIAEAGLVRPMQADSAELAARNERLRQENGAQARARASAQAQPALPLSPAAEAALRQLFQAAGEEGLNLDQGDYRLTDESGTARRYQLTLPVTGSYPAIRVFLAKALNGDHALALNAVQLRREAIEEADLDAVLRFTLYLGTEP